MHELHELFVVISICCGQVKALFACICAGKQRNLRSWLSGSQAAAAPGCSVILEQPSSQLATCPAAPETVTGQVSVLGSSRGKGAGGGSTNGLLGKRPSKCAVQLQPSGRSKAAKLRPGPGQSSLRAFMKPQAQPPDVSAQQQEALERANMLQARDQSTAAPAIRGDPMQLSERAQTVRLEEAQTASAGTAAGRAIEGGPDRRRQPNEAMLPDLAFTGSGFRAVSGSVTAGMSASAAGTVPKHSMSSSCLSWSELAAKGVGDAADALAEAASNWDSNGGVLSLWMHDHNMAFTCRLNLVEFELRCITGTLVRTLVIT